ncbi:uncharacterized protein VTP21DRAFT_5720 [Calcarisporiella thermophila]|uniref:uncharacterized protein n=1 Tax=Calcarisporiella thermophila TaxID=911321 RepID=UPI003742776E
MVCLVANYIHAQIEMSEKRSLSYDLFVWFFNILLDIFFREIQPRGAHKIPLEGPVIFVAAPHANQFVDPLVLMRECPRRVSFLIAEKSTRRALVGAFARAVHSIPVTRPQDITKTGRGRIRLADRYNTPTRITGEGTQFTQFAPGYQIHLPKNGGAAEIVEIISDTECVIKREFKDLTALEMLTSEEGSSYKYAPPVNQTEVYKQVFKELANGHCVGIFPEGGSHDRGEIMPLKAGVTIMALGAMASNPDVDVKIVPCGLNYFHAHRFRSRAVVEFGQPISVSRELVEKYKLGGAEKREACGKLLDTIYNALKSVTVNAPDYETLMLIQAARRLYKPAHRRLHISQVVELNRRLVYGYNLFKDEPKVKELKHKVSAYNQLLKYHGLKDHQVQKAALHGGHALSLLIYRMFWLAFWGILSLPGAILNLPVAIVARVISSQKAKEALAASTVKIAGRDVLATWKLLVALVLVPLLYFSYTMLVLFLTLRYDLAFKWKFWLPVLTWVTLPILSYMSLRFAENGMDIYKSLQPLLLSLLPWERTSVVNLRTVRERLSSDITELINEYGPKVFPDFDPNRVALERHEGRPLTPTPSSARLAGGFFTTPLEWLDDKVFQWGRADDQEADEYFFFLDRRGPGGFSSRSRSRSRTPSGSSSRARSRTSSFGTGFGGEGLRVEAMTELSRDKPFAELTRKARDKSRERYLKPPGIEFTVGNGNVASEEEKKHN